jgi:hypothetical protein
VCPRSASTTGDPVFMSIALIELCGGLNIGRSSSEAAPIGHHGVNASGKVAGLLDRWRRVGASYDNVPWNQHPPPRL